jgi:glycosyltransferase involved in cell wall biosynthesis
VYFSPLSLDDLIEKLSDTLMNPALKAQLVERGTQRLAHFPLQKSIDQTLNVYKSLA